MFAAPVATTVVVSTGSAGAAVVVATGAAADATAVRRSQRDVQA